MGTSMCCIAPRASARLSLLNEHSGNSDICTGKPTLEKARDSIDVFQDSLVEAVEVLVKKRQKSSCYERSSVSSRVMYERASVGDGQTFNNPNFLSIDSPETDGGFCWSAPMLSMRSTTDSYSMAPMTKVRSNIYIGSEENANDEDMLTRNGITHVLSLIGHQSSVGNVVRKQKVMNDKGRTDIKDVLDEVYEFMESGQKENNNLLVHCRLGQNRSAVVVIAFLMKKFKINLFRSHRDLKKARPIVQVNVDYAKQLLDLELEYFKENSLPRNWMERDYDEVANDVEYKHENLTTVHHKSMFANLEDK